MEDAPQIDNPASGNAAKQKSEAKRTAMADPDKTAAMSTTIHANGRENQISLRSTMQLRHQFPLSHTVTHSIKNAYRPITPPYDSDKNYQFHKQSNSKLR
jgi:hypothetical protein